MSIKDNIFLIDATTSFTRDFINDTLQPAAFIVIENNRFEKYVGDESLTVINIESRHEDSDLCIYLSISDNHFYGFNHGSDICIDVYRYSTGKEFRSGKMVHNIAYDCTKLVNSYSAFPAETSIISANIGFKTENNGSGTIASGTTSVSVDHGLDVTPSISDIMVTLNSDLGAASYFWVSDVTETSFTINTDADPDVGVDFSWKAKAENVGA